MPTTYLPSDKTGLKLVRYSPGRPYYKPRITDLTLSLWMLLSPTQDNLSFAYKLNIITYITLLKERDFFNCLLKSKMCCRWSTWWRAWSWGLSSAWQRYFFYRLVVWFFNTSLNRCLFWSVFNDHRIFIWLLTPFEKTDYHRKRHREDDRHGHETSKRSSDYESRRNSDHDSRPVNVKCGTVSFFSFMISPVACCFDLCGW